MIGMCGIVGIYANDKLTRENLDYFTKILVNCEMRGRDATGVFNNKMQYAKMPIPSSIFTRTPVYKKIIEKTIGLKYIIGHCRLATRGSPKLNINNHPLFDNKKKFFLVHNGMITSEKWDFNPFLTDTTIMVNATSHHIKKEKNLFKAVEAAQKDLHENGDSFSMFVAGNDEELVFSKSETGYDLYVAPFVEQGSFAFASARHILNLENETTIYHVEPAQTVSLQLKNNNIESSNFLENKDRILI